jgi:hypothetical protein
MTTKPLDDATAAKVRKAIIRYLDTPQPVEYGSAKGELRKPHGVYYRHGEFFTLSRHLDGLGLTLTSSQIRRQLKRLVEAGTVETVQGSGSFTRVTPAMRRQRARRAKKQAAAKDRVEVLVERLGGLKVRAYRYRYNTDSLCVNVADLEALLDRTS